MHYLLVIISIFLVINRGRSQPGPRHLEEVAYDTERNKLMLFGGVEFDGDKWIEPASVYEWDGNTWNTIEASGPVGRRAGCWIYDESSRKTFLFGGVSTCKVQPDSVLLDVWTWDGRRWTLINTTCPVKEPEATYDAVNKRILVYGDASNKTVVDYELPAVFELWTFANGSWKKLSTDGPNIIASRKISFDAGRNKLVVPVFNDNKMTVWEWSDNGWTRTDFEKDCPAYRTRFAMAYNPADKTTYLFGGLSADRLPLGDLWKRDGKHWKPLEIENGPSKRNSAHFVFGNDQLVLYGGTIIKAPPETGTRLCNELWSLRNDEWKLRSGNNK